MRKTFALTLTASFLALGLLAWAATPAEKLPSVGKVISIQDGDTLTIEAAGKEHRCRLLGIDAPEMSYSLLFSEMEKVTKYASADARRELAAAQDVFRKHARAAEAFARQARGALMVLARGKTVQLAYDGKEASRDRYGRLLVYVVADGVDLNAEMVKHGWAVADTRFQTDRLASYVKLWRAAQAAKAGLWASQEETTRPSPTAAPSPAPPTRPEAEKPKPKPAPSVTVYITRTGSKYHRGGCRYLRRSKIPISLVNAKKHYGPCSVCKPPR